MSTTVLRKSHVYLKTMNGTNPKNILLFTDTPLSGGAELQMYLLAKFLDRNKFNPIVCIGPYPTLDKLAKNLENEEIRVIRLQIKHKNDSKQLKLLKEIIKTEKIDLLHVHLWNPASGRFALLAGKSTKTPTIITEHDPFKINPIKNFFKKFAINKVRKIITVSSDNKKLLQKLYPKFSDKIAVIHNGIDLTWWKSQTLSFKKELHKSNETLLGLTVAELHPRKGIHVLLEAIEALVKTKKNLHFAIAGDGPQRKILEKLIAKRGLNNTVTLLGRQKNIPYLMKTADFFVLPSVREAFGMVILEAMVSGLPIIASKTGGIPEIIKNEKTGLLVPPNNPEKLAEAIQKLISSKKLREKFIKNSSTLVEKKFSAKIMARNYEKLFFRLF